MALPSTGPLALFLNIRAEERIKNSSLPATDVSTREISESAGFAEPDAFSEFYGYSSACFLLWHLSGFLVDLMIVT